MAKQKGSKTRSHKTGTERCHTLQTLVQVRNEQWHKAMLYQTPCQNSCSASHLSRYVTSISTYVPILRKTHQNKWRECLPSPAMSSSFGRILGPKWLLKPQKNDRIFWLSLIIPLPSNQSLVQESDSYFSWGKWESQWCAAQAARHPARKREKKAHGHDRTTCCPIPKTHKLSFILVRKRPVSLLSIMLRESGMLRRCFLEWRGIRGMFVLSKNDELTFSRWWRAGVYTVTEAPDGWVVVKMHKEEKKVYHKPLTV